MKDRKLSSNEGFLVVEVSIAIMLITVGVLSFLVTFSKTTQALSQLNEYDTASSALSSLSEELRAEDLADVYVNYHQRQITVAELKGPEGGVANIEIICHTNETTLPAAFGPITDIDGNPEQQSSDASGDYKLLPVQLRVAYLTDGKTVVENLFILLWSDVE